MRQSLIALAASFGAVLGLIQLFEWDCPDEHWILQAVAVDGSVYEAGAGSSCLSAWEDPVFPVAVVTVACMRIR